MRVLLTRVKALEILHYLDTKSSTTQKSFNIFDDFMVVVTYGQTMNS